MKGKTIKAILQKKHKEFVESIMDPRVKELVRQNSIITGGSIVSLLTDQKVSDFDYYFTDQETVIAVAKYYVDLFTEKTGLDIWVGRDADDRDRVCIVVSSEGIAYESKNGTVSDNLQEQADNNEGLALAGMDAVTPAEEEEKPKYRPVFLSTNAITLSNKIQLVIRFYGPPEEIHKNYDFVHCTCWWRSEDGHLELPQAALESIITKELIYQGSRYPLCSIFRTRKFIERGWRINAGQYLKMALQLNGMDLLDLRTLREQLTGVDSLYFMQVIEKIEAKLAKDPDWSFDSNYLIEVINRIF